MLAEQLSHAEEHARILNEDPKNAIAFSTLLEEIGYLPEQVKLEFTLTLQKTYPIAAALIAERTKGDSSAKTLLPAFEESIKQAESDPAKNLVAAQEQLNKLLELPCSPDVRTKIKQLQQRYEQACVNHGIKLIDEEDPAKLEDNASTLINILQGLSHEGRTELLKKIYDLPDEKKKWFFQKAIIWADAQKIIFMAMDPNVRMREIRRENSKEQQQAAWDRADKAVDTLLTLDSETVGDVFKDIDSEFEMTKDQKTAAKYLLNQWLERGKVEDPHPNSSDGS